MMSTNFKKLPLRSGAGFKSEHFEAIVENPSRLGFVEVHAENYMVDGGLHLKQLEHLSALFPVSLHGVGLSIGGEAPINLEHLARLKILVDRYKPTQFSEHLAWSTHDTTYLNDLLPVAYNAQTLARVVKHVNQVQQFLGVRMLLENPSTYVRFSDDAMKETDFIGEVAVQTGCGLLLDVSNIIVSSQNHQYSPEAYLREFPTAYVGEIHLGGYDEALEEDGGTLLIDAHSREISGPSWDLYEKVLQSTGAVATLIEWDNNIPSFDVLAAEADKAQLYLDKLQKSEAA